MRVDSIDRNFLCTKVKVLVSDVSSNLVDFNIQALNFLTHMKNLEMDVKCEVACRSCPGMLADILAGITEEVEVRQENIFNNILPFECSARWVEGFGCCIVLVESSVDSSRPYPRIKIRINQ